MTADEIVALHKQYVIPTYTPSLALVRGKGARVWDANGKEYLDFLCGVASLPLGHCHPAVVGAIKKQAATLMHVSNLFYNEKQPQLAKALSDRSFGGKCFFCNSGAEANEALIKLARLWGQPQGKYQIITLRNSFHGRTLATLTATGQAKVQKGFDPLPEGFAYAELNDLESVRAAITDKTAAILVEAVQGEGGVRPADPEFLKGLRTLCDQKDILLFFDDVQAGIGRTGYWFGFQAYGVQPDAFSLAKGLGNGFPIGAIVTSPKLSDVFQPGNHATTFGGTPLACATALAVLDTIEKENLLENAKQMGQLFMEKLAKLKGRKFPFIQEVRGRGLLVGLVLDRPAKPLELLLRERGLLAIATSDTVIRFLPPINVTAGQIKKAVRIVKDACQAWAEEIKKFPPT